MGLGSPTSDIGNGSSADGSPGKVLSNKLASVGDWLRGRTTWQRHLGGKRHGDDTYSAVRRVEITSKYDGQTMDTPTEGR